MGVLTWALSLTMSCAFGQGAPGKELVMECQREAVSLNGRWRCLTEHGEAEVWQEQVAAGLTGWKSTSVPGTLLPGIRREDHSKVRSVWAQKTFTLSSAQAARSAVLKWNGIRHGATVWLNGRRLGHHPAIGPHTMLVPAGLARRGENVLLLKVPGWAGIPRGKAGYPLIPTGSGTQGWGSKETCIYDDIWVEFYDRAYLKRVLAMPDLKARTVTFRIWVDGVGKLPSRLDLAVEVRPAGAANPAGQALTTILTDKTPVDVPVAVEDVRAWMPQTPHLYVAELTARAGGKLCDRVRFGFGMRQIEVAGGRYRLNGKRLLFRGSNLVCEWLWGGRAGPFHHHARQYIVEEARVMNLDSFRTHTLPPAGLWADVCDRHGTMILAEFPVLYNYADFKFTPAELKVFHANALLDATGWVSKLANHPSIMIWVLSNESRRDTAWEAGAYWRHVRRLDPTRPCLKTGDMAGTPETTDMHTCGNYGQALEGQVLKVFAQAAAEKDPRRTLTNTEYMNLFAPREKYSMRWLGRRDMPAERLTFAEFAMEHTEAMRRHDFDGIFPYMYAGWTRLRGNNWRDDYPTPMAAALHSCMAPVLASLDLFDRNFRAGAEVPTEVVLINEKHHDVPARVDVYVTPKHPLFVPTAASLAAAVQHQGFEVVFKASSIARKAIRWEAPAAEGVYYLAAVVRREGDRPVVSQRVVRSIGQAAPTSRPQARPVVVLGADAEIQAYLKAREIPHATSLKEGGANVDTVLIWNAGRLSPAARAAAAPAVLKVAHNGGKVVVLAGRAWPWKELADFRVGRASASRAFPYPEIRHPLLKGIDPEWLKRWNGLAGAVTTGVIAGDMLQQGQKLLWAEDPGRTVALSLPVGRGEMLICLLALKQRISPAGGAYDPAAERIFQNLLAP